MTTETTETPVAPTEPTSTPTPEQPEGNAVSGIFAQEGAPVPETPTTHAPAPETPPAETPVEQPVAEAAPTEPVSPTAEEPATEPVPERVVPKPSEYVVPEGTPDHLRLYAHNQGFTQEQLTNTLNEFGGYVTGMEQSKQQALRELGEAHLKNWGPDAQTKLTLAKRALQQNDPEGQLAKALNESGYGNHPAVLDFLHGLGKSMQEGGYLKGNVRRPPGQKTAATALFGETHPSSEG